MIQMGRGLVRLSLGGGLQTLGCNSSSYRAFCACLSFTPLKSRQIVFTNFTTEAVGSHKYQRTFSVCSKCKGSCCFLCLISCFYTCLQLANYIEGKILRLGLDILYCPKITILAICPLTNANLEDKFRASGYPIHNELLGDAYL